MQDRPTTAELLATVAGFLEDELMPTLDGPLAYRTRVAANLIRILQRENALGPAALHKEYEQLCRLLDIEAAPGAATADGVIELNAQLVAAIEAGRVTHDRAWPVLMEIARDKLAIIRPGYDAWDAQEELA